jgi:hypothetical protein
MRRFDDYGISDLVGFILVLLIVTGAISTILLWAVPYMDDQRARIRQESASLQLDPFNTQINDIFKSGVSATSSSVFKTDSGTISLDIIIKISIKFLFLLYLILIKFQIVLQSILNKHKQINLNLEFLMHLMKILMRFQQVIQLI